MELFTDPSLIGFGGFFKTHWFCSSSPDSIPSVNDDDLSMAFLSDSLCVTINRQCSYCNVADHVAWPS